MKVRVVDPTIGFFTFSRWICSWGNCNFLTILLFKFLQVFRYNLDSISDRILRLSLNNELKKWGKKYFYSKILVGFFSKKLKSFTNLVIYIS